MWNCWELILGPKKNPVWRIWRNFLRACIRDLSFLLFLSKFLKAWLSLGLLWQACYKGPFLGAYLRLCYNRGVPPWGKKPVQVREILFPSCLELDWPLVSCKFWVCSSLARKLVLALSVHWVFSVCRICCLLQFPHWLVLPLKQDFTVWSWILC